jgi:hypothetical protein
MQAVVFKLMEEIGKIEVKDRFDFEDRFLHIRFRPRRTRNYLEHQPSHRGVHVFMDPESHVFKVKPYLEFDKQVMTETHFHVMQEGRPTGFTVVLS